MKTNLSALPKMLWRPHAYAHLPKPTKGIGDVPIILTRTAVPEFFGYFIQKASAELVYQQYSDIKIGDKIQGDNLSGDAVYASPSPHYFGLGGFS